MRTNNNNGYYINIMCIKTRIMIKSNTIWCMYNVYI